MKNPMEIEHIKKCIICESSIIKIDEESNICKCVECKYIFDSPRPTLKELKKFYSKPTKYDEWIKEEKGRNLLWRRRRKKLKENYKEGNLLDIGTGIGQFLFHMEKDGKVYGTEISKSAIEIAKNRYKLDIIEGEVETIDFKHNFDNITLFHILEHVPNPKKTIKKCNQILNKDGIITIAVPNDIDSLKYRIKRILTKMKVGKFSNLGKMGFKKIKLDGSMDEIHLSHFTEEVLKKLLKDNGFKLVNTCLDPYYSSVGKKRIKDEIYYQFCLIIKKIFKINIYECIWIVGKK